MDCRLRVFIDTNWTRLKENGVDIKAVSKRLGHSSIKITYNIYVYVTKKYKSR